MAEEAEQELCSVSQTGFDGNYIQFFQRIAVELQARDLDELKVLLRECTLSCGKTGSGRSSLNSLLDNCLNYEDTPLYVLWSGEHLPKRPKRRSKRNSFASTTKRPKRRSKRNFFASTRSVYPEDMPSNSPQAKQKLISGVYGGDSGCNGIQEFKMEHSALQGPNSQWNSEVKCKVLENKTSAKRWVNIWNIYPDAKVDLKRNEIELTISSPNEDHEFAVFGTPGTEDKKRMQMGIFGGKPKQGKRWQIFVTLFDDTMMAFKRVCEREERKGRKLLTTLTGLFVANSDEDIKIDITGLEDGWEIIGSNLMTIKSKEAWNSPENSTDFPYCVFEIAHIDETKQTFLCGVQASHLSDTAETELVEFFEQEQENEEHLNSQHFIPPQELTVTEDDKKGNGHFDKSLEKEVYKALEHILSRERTEALEKALTPKAYDIGILTNAKRNGWESLARALALEPLEPRERFKKPKISFTDAKIRDMYDLLLRWKQEQIETFVLFLMLVPFVTCLTGTPFVTPHLLKVEETEASLRTLGE